MMVFEITYRCREKDEDGQIVEGENCCRLRAKEDQVVDLHNHGRYALSYAARAGSRRQSLRWSVCRAGNTCPVASATSAWQRRRTEP